MTAVSIAWAHHLTAVLIAAIILAVGLLVGRMIGEGMGPDPEEDQWN